MDSGRMHSIIGHRALRKGRRSISGQIYLLTTVTAERRHLFSDVHLARAPSRCMIDITSWGDANPLCWVLMPDHWHGVIELGERDSVSTLMSRFKSSCTRHLRLAGATGNVWARGFHDHALRHDENLYAAASYVLANPLRAGLVENIHDYPYWDSCWL